LSTTYPQAIFYQFCRFWQKKEPKLFAKGDSMKGKLKGVQLWATPKEIDLFSARLSKKRKAWLILVVISLAAGFLAGKFLG
jgi:hypothetical protein